MHPRILKGRFGATYSALESVRRERVHQMDGTKRSDINIGAAVKVVQKQDQSTGKLTDGVVKKILTNSPVHPHGIKVMLEGGIVGRVKEIE